MTNPYLEGNFGPVVEEVTALDLAVTGTLPAELDGSYLRNGPEALREGRASHEADVAADLIREDQATREDPT